MRRISNDVIERVFAEVPTDDWVRLPRLHEAISRSDDPITMRDIQVAIERLEAEGDVETKNGRVRRYDHDPVARLT